MDRKAVVLFLWPLLAFAADAPVAQTKQTQAAMTPQSVLRLLEDGNERFRAGHPQDHHLLAQVQQTSSGQFPLAAILSCIDSRTPSELIFDQGIGDVFNARVAGNIVTNEILGSLEYATKVAGAKLVVVEGHTSCGAVHGAIEKIHLGHVSQVVHHLQPAVREVAAAHHGEAESDPVAEVNVRNAIREIRRRSPILHELESQGAIKIIGAMYDVKTGKVTFQHE